MSEVAEHTVFKRRQIISVGENMRWQFVPQTACGMKEGNCIAFDSRVSNGDTILVSFSSSTSIAGPGQGRGHAIREFMRAVTMVVTIKK